ncbi:MAG: SUMF1/EgtB/PvdO family nonheme iron enzyme [Alphaproteobacteria bacterium]|nr:SUMF1/EgtB/PvdO family nonheme iron enzyme [Alphaproteobacteria bacterium]
MEELMSGAHPAGSSVELPLVGYGATYDEGTVYEDPSLGASMSVMGSLSPATAPPGVTRLDGLPERYVDLGPLGSGGMGEVRRVRDRELNRSMALKVIKAKVRADPQTLARFVEEAQVTAQLQHPGVVPVHELGRLADGRLYFTMQEIRGRTLRQVLLEVHEHAREGGSTPSATGWTFRRLIDAFRRVCETVAYAHSRGVVHRDLKPQNIMVGDFGEVLVLDWGLAKVLGRLQLDESVGFEPIETARTQDASLATVAGKVSGTPAYMPPEQVQGMRELLGPATDVYGLGAVLFELLSGHPPFRGTNAYDVLSRVVEGRMEPIEGNLPVPRELERVARRALSIEPAARYADARGLAVDVADWLEGARLEEQARAVVAQADELLPHIDELRQEAVALREQARRVLDPLRPHDPAEAKKPGWRLEDKAEQLDSQARLVDLTYVRTLYSALNLAPDLPEAHDRLADHFHSQHVEAELKRDPGAAARAELQLRAHDRGRYASYLEGTGALSLRTDPPGAEVRLHRYEPQDRRLEPVFDQVLGTTPLTGVRLPQGSYLLTLHAPGRSEVRYPVLIERGAHWDGVPPGEAEPLAIPLPEVKDLGPDDVYVPAGWFISGGDPEAADGLPRRRLWVDGFVVRRFPVTNAEYLAFLNALVAEGREEEALRHAPAERLSGPDTAQRRLVYGRDDGGAFVLKSDEDGVEWQMDWPVCQIDWTNAVAFAEAAGSGWRLPHDQEWEKAARGVDGRYFPWGDFFESTWACTVRSHSGTPCWASVHDYPEDVSPYEVRGLVGNVRDWCWNPYDRVGPAEDTRLLFALSGSENPDFKMVRGGAWGSVPALCRPTGRFANRPDQRYTMIGFRMARPLGPTLR